MRFCVPCCKECNHKKREFHPESYPNIAPINILWVETYLKQFQNNQSWKPYITVKKLVDQFEIDLKDHLGGNRAQKIIALVDLTIQFKWPIRIKAVFDHFDVAQTQENYDFTGNSSQKRVES